MSTAEEPTSSADDWRRVEVVPVRLFAAVCHYAGCTWRQQHVTEVMAQADAATHEREWHTSQREQADEWEAKLQRLVDAARKIVNGPQGGHHPTHLGDCIGVLSEPKCSCGLTDLRFAVAALDKQ
jgi:hypothetical protein